MKFTKRALEAVPATGKRQHFFDDDFTGFALRVSEVGKKSFYYTYRVGKGRGSEKKWVMLGIFPAMTVDQARQKCKEMAAVVLQGVDPSQEVREEKNAILVADALDLFTYEYVAKLKPGTVSFYNTIINAHLKPRFGKIRARDLRFSEIARFHTAMRETPYAANRSVNVLSVFLNWCELHGYREKNSNPCQQVSLFKEEKRMEFMDEEVLSKLSDALATMEANWAERKRTSGKRTSEIIDTITPQSAAAFRLLMFTGARKMEILSLKWNYISFELGIARLSDSKTGFKVLQLPAPALAILEAIPKSSEFVFPSESASGHMTSLKEAWDAVCTFAGLNGWRIHDLRHAFASVMVNSGASLPIIGKILGHTQTGTTQRYAHLQENPAKKAAEEAAAKIAAIAEKPNNAEDAKVRGTGGEDVERMPSRKLMLQELRFREGLSQKELAQLSGVTFQSISAFENGKRPIGKSMAKKLAGPLGIAWEDILSNAPKKSMG
ncbi:tyrosine-type recombinase/integrase [Desulfovibrio falkowii]|uniref:tyrosine-type recombinase/integrase n=1 Tax=Desulfovibrio sp. WGS1351 TaxID=3366814 RepID=UPI00372CEE85